MQNVTQLCAVAMLSLLICCSGSCGGSVNQNAALSSASFDEPTVMDEWAVVLIDGERAGHVHNGRSVVNGLVHTRISSEFSMKRGGLSVSLSSTSIAVETPAGVPLSFSTKTAGSGFNKTVAGRIENETIELVTTTSGVSHRSVIPWPADCLLPEGVRLLGQSHGLIEETQYRASIFDFESLTCQTTTYTIKGHAVAPVPEKTVDAHLVLSEVETAGGRVLIRSWVDDRFRLIMSSVQMMGMQFDTIAVDRKTALERHEGPEVFTRTFIDSPRKISAAERRRKLSYLLSGINPESRLVIPQSFEQSSAATSDQIRVTVTPHPLPLGESINTKVGNAAVMPFLLPGAWIQSTASEVAALSATAVNGARYKGEAARRIEEFVSRYMKPSGLETGYASALETLRTRKGDCTEYALLTAALCRAAGIPARIALGLVYAETGHGGRRDFFGGHAWTQVFLDGHWYSLDAALGGFGAGHVAVSYNNGDPENLTALVNAIGNIRILSID